ncbi:sigma factor, partial [Acinetobacter baumannii]
RMTGNRADAEDLLQESFLIAFKNLGQLKDINQFGGWLKRIVVNECIRFSKKNFYWDDWDESKEDTLPIEDIEWWKT